MKKYYIILLCLTGIMWGCNDEEFLNKEPQDILLEEQIFADENLILTVVGNFYNRFPKEKTIAGWESFTLTEEAFASSFGLYGIFENNMSIGPRPVTWDYGFIRELNVFLEKIAEADQIDPTARDRFEAEVRLIRAATYFKMVQDMGGVPLILEPLSYDFSGDASSLQFPRAKEHEIYDFVISELDEIKNILPDDPGTKSRATKGLALAMQSRAALYAGSIARYNQKTPSLSLAGGEVGIPAAMASGYYEKALSAAQEITGYALYLEVPDNLQRNFADLFLDKSNNPEVIFVEDFQLKNKAQGWTLNNMPYSLSDEGTQGGRLNPSLNLVQSFELLDNTFAPLPITDQATGEPISYDDPEELFANRDARLWGTVIYPGATYREQEVDIWAGYRKPDGTTITSDTYAGRKELEEGGPSVQVVGEDGPIDGLEYTAQTGFYVRKYVDPAAAAGAIGTQSEVWWIIYRYGEVLLNAAEAAFELGQSQVAADYLNQVRTRAGFTTPLTPEQVTFERIVHERRVELAFEGHRMADLKRWRIAHEIYNGQAVELSNNPANALAPQTRIVGLWPYIVYAPGSPENGKWIFEERVPSRITASQWFQMGSYYGFIPQDFINANPLIVRNPYQ